MLPSLARHPRVTLGALILVGLLLRTWGITSSSMTHYDEFYYAQSGLDLWIVANAASPDSRPSTSPLNGLHPMLPFHAPALYPLLIAAVHGLVGGYWYSAGAVVSAVLGTATIPLFYALAVRITGGRTTGLLGAGLLALSDFHVAYSRMWLTDATLGFFFVAVMYCLVRWMQDGRWWWATMAGLVVGAAWNVKYNGWMPLAIGLATWLFVVLRTRIGRADARSSTPPLVPMRVSESWPAGRKALGAFVMAGAMALLLFLPWLVYVERHFPGGYAAVAGHHGSFSTVAKAWHATGVAHVAGVLQAWWWTGRQLLEGLPAFRHWGWCFVLTGGAVTCGRLLCSERGSLNAWGTCALIGVAWIGALAVGIEAFLLLSGIVGALICLASGRAADVLVAVWLGAFAVSVPAYHAYPRLLVPAVPAAILTAIRGWALLVEASGGASTTARIGTAARASAVICVTGVCLSVGRFDVSELRGVWSCWSGRESYRAFADLVARSTPPDAWLLCRSQPTLWYALRREYKGRDDEPLLDYFPPDRPAFLALDFHVHTTPRAFGSLQAGARHLEEVGRVTNDMTPPAMLNMIPPEFFWAKMKALGSRPPNETADTGLPQDLRQPGPDSIILYRVQTPSSP